MKEEKFVPIKGFESRYLISNHGTIISIGGKYDSNTKVGRSIDNTGYYCATLRSKPLKRRVRVHTLVAEHFLYKPQDDYCVNHKDGNKLNNNVSNLEWCTRKENCDHALRIGLLNVKGSRHSHAKLNESIVLKIRSDLKFKYSNTEIGKMFGVHRRTIADVVNNKLWTHV